MLLKDKVVLITGASRGIGRACAVICAREGAKVVLNYYEGADKDFGNQSAISEALEEVEKVGGNGKAVAVEGDVSLPETAQKLVDEAVRSFGKIDVLVANAGISVPKSFTEIPPALYKKIMSVNMDGVFYTTQAVGKRLVEQGHGGAIVAISSICALLGGEFHAHYSPTKAGVHSLMQCTAISLGKHGIRCNSIMPGAIETDMNPTDPTNTDSEVYKTNLDKFISRIPLQRYGKPEEIAEVVAFLASDKASYVNGAAWLVDGGGYVNLH